MHSQDGLYVGQVAVHLQSDLELSTLSLGAFPVTEGHGLSPATSGLIGEIPEI